ncbi:MAG: hypothetical protein HFG45_06135 [Oscillospiraceae bacterium]|jgi:hypothetical protein|nr:hypothetical protein [Oscillospiraceae bacterium]
MTPLTHIHGVGHVAARYGLEEAIFLDSIMFWYRANRADGRNYHDGRWWTYNSVAAYEAVFPWWSAKQIRRIIDRCRDKGALLDGDYNEDRRDRTAWYTPSDELLALYGEAIPDSGKCICPNGQMQMPDQANASAQTGEPLPCIDHVDNYPPYNPPTGDQALVEDKPKKRTKSVPKWKPERFEAFWKYYPRGEDRAGAVRQWDRLKPSDDLIETMARALKRQKATKDWQNDIGIPYACRWLRDRRWEDEISVEKPKGKPQPRREVMPEW